MRGRWRLVPATGGAAHLRFASAAPIALGLALASNAFAQSADLSVTMTVSDDRPDEGAEIVYAVTVSNAGPDTAGVIVDDQLPPGVTFVQVDSIGQGFYDELVGQWTVGAVPMGAMTTLEIRASVDAGTGTTTGTGQPLGVFASGGGLSNPAGLVFGPDGDLYVSSFSTDQVLRYDGATGAFVEVFADGSGSGLDGPGTLAFGPDGNLYVGSFLTSEILRFDGVTGVFIDLFASGSLAEPTGIVFGPNGNLFIASHLNQRVYEFDGETGGFIGTFAGPEGIEDPRGIAFGGDGRLYAADQGTNKVLRFDGATGALIDALVVDDGSVDQPHGLAFGPAGDLFVAVRGADRVLRYEPTGSRRPFAAAGGLDGPTWLTFGPDGDLYVSSSLTDEVLRYRGFITNVATVSAIESDPDLLDNTAAVAISVNPPATDLVVTKAVSNRGPVEGEEIVYTVTASNEGPEDASVVRAFDTLPAGVTFVSIDSIDQGTYDELAGVWDVGLVPSGAARQLALRASVDAGSRAGTLVNGTFATACCSPPEQLVFGPDGHLYVVALDSDRVARYDGRTGASLGTFTNGGFGLSMPFGLAFGLDRDLYVTSDGSDTIRRYDGLTGAFIDDFADLGPGATPRGIAFGPGGDLYVCVAGADAVRRYDGVTGAFIGDFVFAGGLDSPQDLVFGPDGNLYLTSRLTNEVRRYDGTTGSFIDVFAWTGGLDEPIGLAFGPGGDLFVASSLSNEVIRYDGATGAFVEAYPTDLPDPRDVTFGPRGDLFVTHGSRVGRYRGTITNGAEVTGAVADTNKLNDAAAATILVPDPEADLTVLATVSDDQPVEGQEITYTVVVTNDGPARSPGSLVYDLLPAGVTFAGVDLVSQGSYDEGTGAWTVGELLPGASAQLDVRATVDAGAAGFYGTGQFIDIFATDGGKLGLAFGPDGNLYAINDQDQIVRFDGATGAFLGVFAFDSGVDAPYDLAFGPDGDLYVSDELDDVVERFDGATGAYLGTFASGNMTEPRGLAFGPDGHLYVSSSTPRGVVRFDGHDGSFLDLYLNDAAFGLLTDHDDLVFGPHGAIYIANGNSDRVVRFDGSTPTIFATGGGLDNPEGLAFGPDGHLYVVSKGTAEVVRFDGATGAPLGVYTMGGPAPGNMKGLTFGPDGSVYVAADNGNQILRYRGFITNIAVAKTGAADGDPDVLNDEDRVGIFPAVASSDLAVTKTVSDPTPEENDEIVYTVTVTNDGPTLAPGVTVTDQLPAGVTFVQVDSIDQGMYDEPSGTWDIGELANGQSVQLVLRAQVDVGTAATTGTGAFIDVFAMGGGIDEPTGMSFGPDGNLYVAGKTTNEIYRYDGTTGAFIDVFASGGGLNAATDIEFGPDGNLYVTSDLSSQVLRYDGTTGAFIDVFASGTGIQNPRGLTFGPDGDLYVSNPIAHAVYRYDGADGSLIGLFASGGGLMDPRDLGFGPDGNLYVVSRLTNQVLRYDGATGAFIDVFAEGGGLSGPRGITFGPTGDLYAGSWDTDEVIRYDGATGAFVGVYATGGGLDAPDRILFGPDGNLYVASRFNDLVLRYVGFITNVATASSSGDDPNRRNDSAAVGIDPRLPTADVAVTKTVDDPTPEENEEIVYTVTVTNDGPNIALGVTVTDQLPSGVTFVQVDSIDQGSYDEPSGAWDVGELANGQGAQLALRASVDAGTAETTGTGEFISVFATGGGLAQPWGVTFGADGDLYVASWLTDQILRYDGTTGAFLGEFASGGGLFRAAGLSFGPDGNMYLASRATDQVLRYDGTTGAFIDVFASGSGLDGPYAVEFGPDDNLYVASAFSAQVLRYDGATGAFIDVFASGTTLTYPYWLTFGPDGNLYVGDTGKSTSRVARFDGTTGAFIDDFATAGGLHLIYGMTFGPDGNLYVSSGMNNEVLRYDATTGDLIDAFASGPELDTPTGLTFGPDGDFYVSSWATNEVLRYRGFIKNAATASSASSTDPNGLNNTASVGITVQLPTGACCNADGSCSDGATQADCEGAGGLWQGQATTCAGVTCPDGACCLSDGGCVDAATAGDCATMEGTWQGAGNTCAMVSCPMPGACCLGDGTCRQELVTGGAQCVLDGGTYQGDDTDCGSVTCPGAACCLTDGSCTDLPTAGDCTAAGGSWQGAGNSCAMVACPQPGACCLDDGTCRQELETGGAQCALDGGTYQGDDTDCGMIVCPGAACCLADGTCSDEALLTDCDVMGGAWQGAGTTCAMAPCPDGACCLDDGTCTDVATAVLCAGMNGAWQGAGNACSGVACPGGACCLGDGSCSDEATADDCLALDGVWQGAPSDCGGVTCPLGACCLADDTCVDVAPVSCAAMGGLDQGDGSTCTADTCPPSGQVRALQKVSMSEGGFTGPLAPGDRFGSALAAIGDVDGDGVDDLAVGAPDDDDGGLDRGAVWILFLDADGTVKSEQKISALEGGFGGPLADGDGFGSSVTRVGDLDQDGVGDIAVGAPFDDGDGLPGADRGAIWILLLHADGTVKDAVRITGGGAGGFSGVLDDADWFGSSVRTLGPVNADTVPDLVVGAPGTSSPAPDDGGSATTGGVANGAVWILFMNPDGTVASHRKIAAGLSGFTGPLGPDEFGRAVGALGDLDGDGRPDVAVGAPRDNGDAGAVWVLLLNGDGSVKEQQKIDSSEGGFTGTLEAGDAFGSALVWLRDLDRDGTSDLAVGAPGDDDGLPDAGAVWSLFLNTDGTVREHEKVSATAGHLSAMLDSGDGFGGALASLADLDGDGVRELVAGAPFDDDGAGPSGDEGALYVLFVAGVPGPIVFELPVPSATTGQPLIHAVGDLDTIDGTIDVAVVIPDAVPSNPGQVQIFLNQGVDGGGAWLGLIEHPTVPLITVGADPSDITAGDVNGDGYLDLAVTNANDGTVSILLNSGDGNGVFTVSSTVGGLNAPSAIAYGDFVNGSDLAVANEGNDEVVLLENDGAGVFTPLIGFGIPVDIGPVSIDPRDIDDDRDVDLVSGNGTSGTVTVIINEGGGVFTAQRPSIPVGAQPVDLAIGDLDLDGLDDIVTADNGDGTVSIILNLGPSGGPVTFGPAMPQAAGIAPQSVEAVDLDLDADLDLVVAGQDAEEGPALLIIENLLLDDADGADGPPTLAFGVPQALTIGAVPEQVLSADFNADTNADLVTVNVDADEPNGSVTVILNAAPPPCPTDIDGSGDTGFGDILQIIGAWGPCQTPTSCAADQNGDQEIGFADLLIVIGAWGECPS